MTDGELIQAAAEVEASRMLAAAVAAPEDPADPAPPATGDPVRDAYTRMSATKAGGNAALIERLS